MNKMKELKVFRIGYENKWDDLLQLNFRQSVIFACRGEACEYLQSLYVLTEPTLKEDRVLYSGDINLRDDDNLWRAISIDDVRATSWYTTEAEAMDAAESLKLTDPLIQSAWYCDQEIAPLPERFKVEFKRGADGRLYTRFDSHPERDGRTTKGKVFFPDRSFVEADAGEAMVSISTEFDTYGFVKGEMIPFGMPDMKEFLDWAWENMEPENRVIFVNHPGRGRYLVAEVGEKKVQYRVRCDNGIALSGYWYDSVVQSDVERYTERVCTLAQLFFEDSWNRQVEEDLSDVRGLFGDVDKDLRAANCGGLDYLPLVKSDKFWGEIADEACRRGFMSQYCVPDRQIELFEVYPENTFFLSLFSYEEVQELAKLVNEVNAKAVSTVKALHQKGKI